jgi:hypothetical protein
MAFLLTLATNVQNTFRSRKRLSQFLLLSSLLLLSNAFLMAPNHPGRAGKGRGTQSPGDPPGGDFSKGRLPAHGKPDL